MKRILLILLLAVPLPALAQIDAITRIWNFIDCGLVNQVVPDDALASTVQDVAENIATKSPLSIARIKQLVSDGTDQPLHSALRQEINMLIVHSQSHDMREGLAAFNEKRKPIFTGR